MDDSQLMVGQGRKYNLEMDVDYSNVNNPECKEQMKQQYEYNIRCYWRIDFQFLLEKESVSLSSCHCIRNNSKM